MVQAIGKGTFTLFASMLLMWALGAATSYDVRDPDLNIWLPELPYWARVALYSIPAFFMIPFVALLASIPYALAHLSGGTGPYAAYYTGICMIFVVVPVTSTVRAIVVLLIGPDDPLSVVNPVVTVIWLLFLAAIVVQESHRLKARD